VIDNLVSRGEAPPVGLVDVMGGSHVGETVNDVPVRWDLESAAALSPDKCTLIVALGDNAAKLALAEHFAALGFGFRTAVHAFAMFSPNARIATGAIVNAGAVILPNAEIGEHAIVHSGCVIEHDCQIGAGANIAPGVTLAGRVVVGRSAYLYTGCRVVPGVRIGDGAIVGAGAVVLSSVADGVTAFGVPARTRNERES